MTALAGAVFGLATPASAQAVFTGSSGNLDASVVFNIVGGNLVVTLTNTSTADVNSNPQVLNAVFFDIAGTPTLTYTDADLTAGSHFVGTVLGSGTDIAAEWAYNQNASGLGHGVSQDYGLSSAGYNIFGPGNVLGGSAHPNRGGTSQPPGGPDFGLVSAGYTSTGDSNGFTNQEPFIDNSATFTLGGFSGSLLDISNVRFQYGTSISDDVHVPGVPVPPVPEPATWAMMLLGFAGIGAAVRRKRHDRGTLMQVA